MSKTLIVMRHAKSSWDTPCEDIARALNARGRNGALALGEWLRRHALTPDTILCSSAARTQETAALLRLAPTITNVPALYMASSDILLKHVQRASGGTLLVIAHNPGIGEFAERLAQHAPNHARFYDYPSGATSVLSCAIDSWTALTFGSAALSHFTTPKDLL